MLLSGSQGLRIHYEVSGEGPPLVLLHHATASSRNWRRLAPVFSRHFQVIAYDRPGFGRSDWLDRWTLDYLRRDVDDLVALMDHLRVEQAALLGHSDGAAISLWTAALHPGRVRCVVAEAPHVFVEVSTCPAAVRQYAGQVYASAELQAILARDHGARGLQVMERWAARWTDPAFWDWDISAELDKVRCPVLVVQGAEDPYFPLAHAQLVAGRLPGSELWVVPGVGHVPHAEAAEQYTARVLRFLQDQGG